ncbi:MAG: glycosyltransferase [Acidimicrobiales bacterium]
MITVACWRDEGVVNAPRGIDRFVAAARAIRGRRYVLVGRVTDPILAGGLADPPPNLVVTGYVDDQKLRELLWSSGIYAQLSWHEGYGVSMVEAMQAGCRPVVTEVPALREIAGPEAVLSRSPDDDVPAIDRAARITADRGDLAAWAASVSSLDERAAGLGAALFAPASRS